MTRSATLRTALVVAALAAAGVACKSSTTQTTASPTPAASGSFELVGRVTLVTLNVVPPSPVPVDTSSPSASNTPRQSGEMRVTVQSASDELRNTCGTRVGDSVSVFWLTQTRFDPSSVLATDMRTSLDGNKVSAQGRIFSATAMTSPTPAAAATVSPSASPSPSPTVTPLATTGAATTTTTCTLVADHVEVGQGAATGVGRATTGSPSPTVSPHGTMVPGPTTSFPPGIRRSPAPTITP
jgi:hypothetical protein